MTRHPKGDQPGWRAYVCSACGAFCRQPVVDGEEPDPPACNWCSLNAGPGKAKEIA